MRKPVSYQNRERMRIEISVERAIELFNLAEPENTDADHVIDEQDLNDVLGNGRVCIGIKDEFLSIDEKLSLVYAYRPIIMVVKKETYPGIYYIGEC